MPRTKKQIPTINIHGNEYVTVATRVALAHEELDKLDIQTEVLFTTPVVIKATVTTKKGVFTGISAANPSKTIEKMSPFEVAETSAVGRALGFAGYGAIESIASADEVVHAAATDVSRVVAPKEPAKYLVTPKQIGFIRTLLKDKGFSEKELCQKYEVTALEELTGDQASTTIQTLMKLPKVAYPAELDLTDPR